MHKVPHLPHLPHIKNSTSPTRISKNLFIPYYNYLSPINSHSQTFSQYPIYHHKSTVPFKTSLASHLSLSHSILRVAYVRTKETSKDNNAIRSMLNAVKFKAKKEFLVCEGSRKERIIRFK